MQQLIEGKNRMHTQKEVECIKQKYHIGTKVKLIKMYDELSTIPAGTEGIIESIDDIGTLHINWNNGSSLGLIVGVDEFEIVEETNLSKRCINCGKEIIGYPAISRKDNKTEICSKCGTLEALEVFKKYQNEKGN